MPEETPKEPGNASVLMKYFGRKEGENIQGFTEELKQLSPEEKAQMAEGIKNGSLTY